MTIHGHTERGAFLGVRDAGFARTWVLIFAGCWLGLICTKSWGAEVATAHPSAEQIEFFENKIRPVLTQHCYSCHSAEATKLKAGLRLDSRAGLLKGGDTGPAIVPGQPDASLLIQAVRYKDEDTAMPPKKPLPEALVADLEAWVRMGSPWPETEKTGSPARVEIQGFDWAKFRSEHWAFRNVVTSEPPTVKNASWVSHPIDQFVLARLQAAGLKPASPAENAFSFAGLISISLACHPLQKRLRRFLPTRRQTPLPRLSTRSLPRRNMVNTGGDTGWMSRATATD